MPVLEVKNIRKSFDGVQVLKGISFGLEKGKVLSIIGSSGSGKTTLLRCMNFLEHPEEGQILVNGQLLFDASRPGTLTDAARQKIVSSANPFDERWNGYFEERDGEKMLNSTSGREKLLKLWRAQKRCCPICGPIST